MTQPDGGAGGAHESTDHASAAQRSGRWASLTGPTVPAIGLVPLRIFLGVTYLYAGVDKVANTHFLATGDPVSVAAQVEGFARTSPLAPLINAAMPVAIQIGFLIALAELAVGLGVLTGLSFRLAAAAGAAISLLFWLTASWSSTPYFFSPDLPYAAGFLTLALVGHGGLLVVGIGRDRAMGDGTAHGEGKDAVGLESPGRRSILQLGVLAALTLVAVGVAASLRLLGSGAAGGGSAASGGATKTPAPATPAASGAASVATAAPSMAASPGPSAPPATPAPTSPPTAPPASAAPATPAGSGPVIGSLADFSAANGIPFTVPYEAPTGLNPGGPGIMVKLGDGTVVAYNALCTHGRCTVGWDSSTSIIQCPCHSARYDPANQAAVLSGPAPSPLTPIPVTVDQAGQIHVTVGG